MFHFSFHTNNLKHKACKFGLFIGVVPCICSASHYIVRLTNPQEPYGPMPPINYYTAFELGSCGSEDQFFVHWGCWYSALNYLVIYCLLWPLYTNLFGTLRYSLISKWVTSTVSWWFFIFRHQSLPKTICSVFCKQTARDELSLPKVFRCVCLYLLNDICIRCLNWKQLSNAAFVYRLKWDTQSCVWTDNME